MVYSCEVCSYQFHLPILADADILASCPECGSMKIKLALIHNARKKDERNRQPANSQLVISCA